MKLTKINRNDDGFHYMGAFIDSFGKVFESGSKYNPDYAVGIVYKGRFLEINPEWMDGRTIRVVSIRPTNQCGYLVPGETGYRISDQEIAESESVSVEHKLTVNSHNPGGVSGIAKTI